MHSSFSFKRVGLLIRRNFIENYIPLIVFPIVLIIGFGFSSPLHADARLIIYMFGLIMPLIQFAPLKNSLSAAHILLIPASHAEKMTATIFIGTFYFVCITLLTYVIGSLAGTYIFNLITGKDILVNWSFISAQGMVISGYNPISPQINIWEVFRITFILQNLIMLVQIGLKDKILAKLFGGLAFITILTIAQPNTYYILFENLTKGSNLNLNLHNTLNNASSIRAHSQTIIITVSYLIILFLWWVNYSLLSKKQV